MRNHLLPLAAVAFLVVVPSAPGQVKDPAELLPARTLAYLEISKPAQVSKDVAALLRGSALQDMPAVMARFREKAGEDYFGDYEMSMLGLLFGPEAVADAGKVHGAFVALTGFDKDGRPEVVGVSLNGDSVLPALFARAYLSNDFSIRSVGEVEGVRMYREKPLSFNFRAVAPGQPAPPPELTGPTYAFNRDLVVIGSSTEAVSAVIRRAKGKLIEPSLAGIAGFRDAAALRDRPGVFGYLDVAALMADVEKIGDGAFSKTSAAALLQDVIGIKALRKVAGSLSLQDGNADLQLQVHLDAAQKSPVLDLALDQPVRPALLHAVPRDAVAVMALSLPDGAKRWQQLVALADKVAEQHKVPADQQPSQVLGILEGALRLKIGPDILAKIDGMALAIPSRVQVPKNGTRLPMVVLSTPDAAAAEALLQLIPRLAGLAQGEVPTPLTQKILGQDVHSLASAGLPVRTQLHYGRQGSVVVLGQDPKIVGEALASVLAGEGLGKDAAVAAAARGKVLVGAGLLGHGIAELVQQADMAHILMRNGNNPKEVELRKQQQAEIAAINREFSSALIKATDRLPPWILTLDRRPDLLTLHWHQEGLKTASAPIVSDFVQWSLARTPFRNVNGTFEFVGEKVQIEAKPDPAKK